MAVVSVARRPAWPVLVVLLAALLTALGMSVALHGQGVASTAEQPRGADTAADGAFVKVVAPVRSVGRLAAEPSPLSVQGPAELSMAGAMSSAQPPALMRLGDQHASVVSRLRAAQRPTAGDRAPPVRLSDR